jgi:hypothetical protein
VGNNRFQQIRALKRIQTGSNNFIAGISLIHLKTERLNDDASEVKRNKGLRKN